MKKIYQSQIIIDEYPIIVAWTNEGLCYVGSFVENTAVFEQWQQKNMPNYEIEEIKIDSLYTRQLKQYISGERQQFELPLHLVGTDFQKKIWSLLVQIPFGTTVSYSDIAKRYGNTSAVRAVANAIGKNPVTIVVPCHRVIGKNGKLTGFRGGLPMKMRLLLVERVKGIK